MGGEKIPSESTFPPMAVWPPSALTFPLFWASAPAATVHCPPGRADEDEWLNIAQVLLGPPSVRGRHPMSRCLSVCPLARRKYCIGYRSPLKQPEKNEGGPRSEHAENAEHACST